MCIRDSFKSGGCVSVSVELFGRDWLVDTELKSIALGESLMGSTLLGLNSARIYVHQVIGIS